MVHRRDAKHAERLRRRCAILAHSSIHKNTVYDRAEYNVCRPSVATSNDKLAALGGTLSDTIDRIYKISIYPAHPWPKPGFRMKQFIARMSRQGGPVDPV